MAYNIDSGHVHKILYIQVLVQVFIEAQASPRIFLSRSAPLLLADDLIRP